MSCLNNMKNLSFLQRFPKTFSNENSTLYLIFSLCNNVRANKIKRDCLISSPLTSPYLPTFLYTADTKQALIRSPTPTPQKNS